MQLIQFVCISTMPPTFNLSLFSNACISLNRLTTLHHHAPTLKMLTLDSVRFLDDFFTNPFAPENPPALNMVHLKIVGKDLKNKLFSRHTEATLKNLLEYIPKKYVNLEVLEIANIKEYQEKEENDQDPLCYEADLINIINKCQNLKH